MNTRPLGRRPVLESFTIAVVMTALLPGSLLASEQTRAVQEELRRRNVFFGNVDGRPSEELQSALKEYQKRKGFTATGEQDEGTLRSLRLSRPAPGEAPPREIEWPQEPVLQSDVALDVAAAVKEVAAETGVAAETLTLAPIKERVAPAKPSARKGLLPRLQPTSKGGSTARPSRRRKTSSDNTNQNVTGREVEQFVREFLRAQRGEDLQPQLQFFADHVHYFGHRNVDRRIVEHTLRRYQQRWPRRVYRLLAIPLYAVLPATGEIVITFNVDFRIKRDGKWVRGKTENRLIINAATEDPRIVAIEERRVRGT